MKAIYRWLFILTVFASPQFGYSQSKAAIQNVLDNTVYMGVFNMFEVAVQDNRGTILVETDNGVVNKEGDFNRYTWRPEHPGSGMLTVLRKTKSSTDTVGRMLYRVVVFPPPKPLFAGKESGTIRGAEARVQIAPYAVIFGGGAYGCGSVKIVEFTLVVLRNNKAILMKTLSNEKGVRFADDEEAAKTISTLVPKDLVLFNDIKAKGPDGKIRDLSPMVFTITD